MIRIGIALFVTIIICGCKSPEPSKTVVLHRSGNPADIYIAKFDALDRELNRMSCEEFAGWVRKMSPETGPVKCSLLE